MRKLKSNFKKSPVIPAALNNEYLIFFGKYKNYSCVASVEPETKETYISVSNGTEHINLSQEEIKEILDKFGIDEYEMTDVKSPLGNWTTRYFVSKAKILS